MNLLVLQIHSVYLSRLLVWELYFVVLSDQITSLIQDFWSNSLYEFLNHIQKYIEILDLFQYRLIFLTIKYKHSFILYSEEN